MKSMIKLFLGYTQKGEFDKAAKILPKVVSSIDTCTKKNLLHKNNAARKKSRLQKMLNNKDKAVIKPVKAEKSAKKEAKKTAKKEAK
jgi:ribosomal protein S20